MKLLLKTTDPMAAMECEKNAVLEYGFMAIYRFKHRSNDGNYYYEILLNENLL